MITDKNAVLLVEAASLYSHFEGKRAILDALVKEVLEQYGANSFLQRPIGRKIPITYGYCTKV
ncbi:MAG: hypothetical protein ACI3V0_11590 [Faecousia sp.]